MKNSWKNNNLLFRMHEDTFLRDHIKNELLSKVISGDDLDDNQYVIPYTEYEKHTNPQVIELRKNDKTTEEDAEENFRGYFNTISLQNYLNNPQGVYIDSDDNYSRVIVNINEVDEKTARAILSFIEKIEDKEKLCFKDPHSALFDEVKRAVEDSEAFKAALAGNPQLNGITKRLKVQFLVSDLVRNNAFSMDGLEAVIDSNEIKPYIDNHIK